ncbi:MAG: hypothetical protein ACKOF9_03760 [Burkholderiales bacterium]
MTTVTKEMIGAAHDVMLAKGDFVLSATLLERIYLAMEQAAPPPQTPFDTCPAKANALLIAAAPDLLQALQGIITSLANQDDEGLIEHSEQMRAARRAIAKALGTEGAA